MSISTTRAQRRQLERENAKWPLSLQPVPRNDWPLAMTTSGMTMPLRVWRSRFFLVQEFAAPAPAQVRLSVSRTTLEGDRWQEGISWDELMFVKAQAGYAAAHAVEVYPAERDIVNVANMRHLWVLQDAPVFAWRRDGVTG